jgi:hypothetical protein
VEGGQSLLLRVHLYYTPILLALYIKPSYTF